MRSSVYLFSLALLTSSNLTLAAPVTEAMTQAITQNLKIVNQQIQIRGITPSPIDGLYQVEIDTGEVILTSGDGKHFVLGDLYGIKGQRFVNLSQQRQKKQRAETLKSLNKDDMVIFSPAAEVKSVVYAFTDVDCGYCQKLHSEMAEYNKAGIEIRYLAFPRGGLRSKTYQDMVSVWCADDPKAAMTSSKSGGQLESKECENPVAEQYAMGTAFGVTGTPALVFEDGSLLPGYLPVEKLSAYLQENM
ncbi:MAG: thioredoxin fold domain-containing protein [Motiliproteus sp.]